MGYAVADVAAALMTMFIVGARLLSGPLVRLYCLSRLRATTTGRIPVTTHFDGVVHALAPANVELGEHCRLGRGVFFETPGSGSIVLGSHVRVNTGTVIVANTKVSIGDDCLIGEYVSIRDADHGLAPDAPMRLQPETSAAISIGQDVWLGRGVTVLKGVTIGDGAVVAANSVVTKDVPARTIVAGSPAQAVRSRDADE